ncbi:MAG: glutamine amidotransferase [Hyphomicrobiales bacterium]
MSKNILIILHQASSSPGRVGQMLIKKGYTLDIRRPRFGEPLPETMDDHHGAIIFGGPMSANDTDDFVKKEIDWCGVPLRDKAPFLGICLGAQMLVKHLGGDVFGHKEGMAEVGYYPLQDLRENTDGQIMPAAPDFMYQWHREGFSVPSSARLLMRSEMFENQAISVGENAFGVQFHTELTFAMLYRWLVTGVERTKLPGAQTRALHLEGRLIYDAAIRSWLDKFLDNWLNAAHKH